MQPDLGWKLLSGPYLRKPVLVLFKPILWLASMPKVRLKYFFSPRVRTLNTLAISVVQAENNAAKVLSTLYNISKKAGNIPE